MKRAITYNRFNNFMVGLANKKSGLKDPARFLKLLLLLIQVFQNLITHG